MCFSPTLKGREIIKSLIQNKNMNENYEWITTKIDRQGNKTTVEMQGMSSNEIRCEIEKKGDGNNADPFKLTVSQWPEPVEIEMRGQWERQELIAMLSVILDELKRLEN